MIQKSQGFAHIYLYYLLLVFAISCPVTHTMLVPAEIKLVSYYVSSFYCEECSHFITLRPVSVSHWIKNNTVTLDSIVYFKWVVYVAALKIPLLIRFKQNDLQLIWKMPKICCLTAFRSYSAPLSGYWVYLQSNLISSQASKCQFYVLEERIIMPNKTI